MTRDDGVMAAHSLFQARGGGSTPTSSLQLWLDVIDFREAKRLNRLWHSRLPEIGDPTAIMEASLCFAAGFDGRVFAVGIWSHPVARLLPQETWLELRRLAIASEAPKNTASRTLSVMTILVKRFRPEMIRLISYQDTAVHNGTIYRSAGWKLAKDSRSNTQWDMPSRPRPKSQSDSPKRCWDKCLVCSMSGKLCEVCHERIE